MGSFSPIHWIVVIVVLLLVFGGGRISGAMGDFAKGIKAFKKGLKDDEVEAPPPPVQKIDGGTKTKDEATRV